MSVNDESPDANISKVAVKPPPFWVADPSLWFAQLESQFSLASITVDDTKFHYVTSAIAPETLHVVRDLILNPPANNKYDTLKQRLIEHHAESEESKIRRLLQGIELGDQRPTQLLTRMRSLAGKSVGDTLLKSLWLARLQVQVQGILAALNEDLNQLASTADKITELTGCYSVNSALSHQPSTSHLPVGQKMYAPQAYSSPLEEKMETLTQQINELAAIVNRRERSKGNKFHNRSRSRSKGRYKEPANNHCFYHTNFGIKARKCNPPCSFQKPGN